MKRSSLPLCLALLLTLSGCYTNPVTGRQALVLLPQGQELTLGEQSFAEIRKKEKASTDTVAIERVRRVGQRIARAVGTDLPDAKWEFVVFDSKELNAFALPGGKVGVYSGLLAVAATDDELATVMSHEIGHVTARHGGERMSQAMLIAGAGAVGGAVVERSTDDPRTRELFDLAYGAGAAVGVVLPHSRNNELEADRMGAVYAARAGYDPRASIAFWQKMVAQKNAAASSGGKLAGLLSTHPPDEKRIADLQALMPQVMPIYEQNKGRFE